MTTTQLFRTRFSFVCDRCDYGYRAGRLAAFDTGHQMICAKCAVGADPDNDPNPSQQEYPTCDDPSTPPAPTLFD